MKKSIKKIISFALMLSLLIGTMAGFNVFAAEETTVEIISNNVFYGDTLNLMYAVRTTDENVVLNIYDNNNNLVETITECETATVKGETAKVFISSKGVPAQNIDNVFYAQAVASDGTKSAMERYSVLEYLYERLTVSTDVTDAQKTMYNNLLAFADSADIVINNDTTTNIAKYSYVRVENGTVDGTYATAMLLDGTVLDSLTTDYQVESGKVLAWDVTVGDAFPRVVKDTDIKAGALTVEGGNSYKITAVSENAAEIVTQTATLSYTTATTGNMTGSNDASKVGLDASMFSVIGNKGATNNNCGLNKAGQIRLYGSSADGKGSYFTVSIADGYTIKSIKITFSNTTNNKNCQLTVDGNSVVFNGSSTTWEADINSDSFELKNVIKGSTTQIYIKSIEITYYKK